jgi:transposase InsO family protein
VAHANARLTPAGRLILVTRITIHGRPAAHVAAEMGISRTTAYRWVARYRAQGRAGLHDRPSTARTCPHRTPAAIEQAIVALRINHKLGPVRIAARLGLAASTVHRVLTRHGLHRLAFLDRPTGRIIRRYERDQPGELLHIDVKKLGRLRPGGGHRVHGRDSVQHRTRDRKAHARPGYDYLHAAVDDHSRLAYVEILPDERGATCAGFLRRAAAWYATHGIRIQRVLSDNAPSYRLSRDFAQAMAELGAGHRFTRPYRPQTNGKVERFNRTMLDEWAYQQPYLSNEQRAAALPGWLHSYNMHRAHTALGGHPPITRINNPAGQYS